MRYEREVSASLEREKISVELTPLTPVHVWSGENYIVGLDLIQLDGDRYCVVDVEKADPSLAEELSGETPERYHEVLRKALDAGLLGCKRELRSRVKLRLGETVRRLSWQLVPGSELKGYMRTAVLYAMLEDIASKNHQEALKMLREHVDVREKPENWGISLEETLLRARRPRKSRGFVDMFQTLLVSDPTVINCSTEVVELMALRMPDMSNVASQRVEAMTSGKLRYDIALLKPGVLRITRRTPEHNKIESILRGLDANRLISSLKRFGLVLLELELDRVEKINELRDYAGMLKDLLDECREGSSHCIPARLGFMTGHESKTVLTLVMKLDRSLYDRWTNVLSKCYKRPWDRMTIKLVKTDGKMVGVGWCKLCLR